MATENGLVNILEGSGNSENILDEGTRNDTLFGSAGNDTNILNDLNQIVEGGSDTSDEIKTGKTFILNSASYFAIENLTLTGTVDIDSTGNALKK